MCFRVFWGAFFPFYLPGLWLLAFVGWLYARGAELQICTRIVWLVDPFTLGTSKHCSSQVLSRCFDVLERLVKKSKAMYSYATLWFQDVHVPFKPFRPFQQWLRHSWRWTGCNGKAVWWSDERRIMKMSAYTHFRQLWGVGILQYFVWIYFSFPFGGPRMWAYSFTRLPWTSRTWGTALDGLFDARVRRDDSVMMQMMPDSHW